MFIDVIEETSRNFTSDLINLINNFCKSIDTTNGLILLVDMGSLEQMYEKIESNVIGDLVILNNVSTALAIECGIQVCQKKPISHFYQMDFDSFQVKVQYYKGLSQKKNVIVSCLSGEGISEKVKDILKRYLDNQVEILIFDFKSNVIGDLVILNNVSTALAIECGIQVCQKKPISHFYQMDFDSFQVKVQYYKGLSQKKNVIVCLNELVKLFTIEGASTKLRFLDSKKVFNEIEKVLKKIAKEKDTMIFKNTICVLSTTEFYMIERIMIGDGITNEHLKTLEKLNKYMDSDSCEFCLNELVKLCIEIPKGEYELIYTIFEQTIF
ncbi:RNA polymerase subunit sigma-54 [Enterococcus faecium]|uniref:RNA polymerase subunit sigma-54 n=1 Tax=Enterococcus faecium TaxID=1352 RepID=UPI0038B3498D